MLFSIVTITYNAAPLLPVTAQSILHQSFTDYEWVVIDGASTDGTAQIAAGVPIAAKTVVSEPDRGLYDAMNKGLHAAKGDYVIFLNAGDAFPLPDTLQRYADAISSAPQPPGIVYGQTQIVDGNRRYIGERHFRAPERLSFKSFAKGMTVCHQAMAVRRDMAPDYDLRYRFSADYDWVCRILHVSPLNVYIPAYTAAYLQEGLTTANRRKSLKERFRIMCRHYGVLPTLLRHVGKVISLPFIR